MSLSVSSDAPVRVLDIKDSIDLEFVIVAPCPAFFLIKNGSKRCNAMTLPFHLESAFFISLS
jgi:hypothetical protein